jgi:hypothetical protein
MFHNVRAACTLFASGGKLPEYVSGKPLVS